MLGRACLDRVILFVVAFLLLAVGSFWGLPSGKAVAGALVILDGGVPYRDFWTMYAPGQFYAVAALFGLFGRELFVQAIAVCLVRAAAAVSFHLLLCRLGASRWSALGLSIVFVLMFWRTAPELTDYAPALLCLLLALNRIVAYFERDLVRVVPRSDWHRFPHLLIWHGRRVCDARRPRCEDCVLADLCPSSRAH